MRVIAGRLGGRPFSSPHSARTHPMSDRVRGALFNTLGDIEGLTALDAFAGTGALGFEAVSRGAASALLLENDKPAQRSIEANIRSLELLKDIKLVKANSSGWSDNNPGRKFDLVLVDPPFDDTQLPVIQKLVRHINEGGLLVLNWPGDAEAPALDGLEVVVNKRHGGAQLVFYR